MADLPVEAGRITPKLFTREDNNVKATFFRAAKRAGFSSKLVQYQLHEISPLLLPVILVLSGNSEDERACILTGIDIENKQVKIILPELGDAETLVSIERLEDEYLGYAFLIKPEHHYKDARKRVLEHEKHHWFWSTIKHSKSIYVDVLIASFLINMFVLATPIFTLNIYDRVVPNNAIDTMWIFAAGIFIVYVFDLLFKFLRAYFLENASKKSDVIMSSIIYEQVLNLKLSSKPKSVGSFANVIKDFDSIKNFFTAVSISTLIDLPFSILFLLVIYMIGGWLVVIPILFAIIIIAYSFIIEKPIRQSIESTYEASSFKNSILIESLSALETIKSLGIGGQYQWKWEEATGSVSKKSQHTKILSNSISVFVGFIIQFNTVVIIVAGVYAIGEKELTMGGLIALVMLGSRILTPLAQIANLITNFEQTKTAYNAINNIMLLQGEREEGKKFVERPSFTGKIEFQNVSFTYPDSERKILNNISFTIHSGESVAIIGANGSGKTTIEKLLLGLYEPQEGSILIDGIDIKQIDPADLRGNISYVPQDVVLFEGTLKENIIMRTPDANDEEILSVAKLSGIDIFVNKHPMGFSLPVGERGDGLSGGQKQAIAIARAFIDKSPILLLDEPTNSMDVEREKQFTYMLQSYAQNRTMILITHRNLLLNLTTRLIVLNNGNLVLDGNRDDVIKKLNDIEQRVEHGA